MRANQLGNSQQKKKKKEEEGKIGKQKENQKGILIFVPQYSHLIPICLQMFSTTFSIFDSKACSTYVDRKGKSHLGNGDISFHFHSETVIYFNLVYCRNSLTYDVAIPYDFVKHTQFIISLVLCAAQYMFIVCGCLQQLVIVLVSSTRNFCSGCGFRQYSIIFVFVQKTQIFKINVQLLLFLLQSQYRK